MVALMKDRKNNIEFFLAGTVLVNENETFNDDNYEFESKGIPLAEIEENLRIRKESKTMIFSFFNKSSFFSYILALVLLALALYSHEILSTSFPYDAEKHLTLLLFE